MLLPFSFTSALFFILFYISPTVATSTDPDMAEILVNGFPIRRRVTYSNPITVALGGDVPITTASVNHDLVRCFFWRRVVYDNYFDTASDALEEGYSTLPGDRITTSFISPLFEQGNDLTLPYLEHFYTSMVCYKVKKEAIKLLLEDYDIPSDSCGIHILYLYAELDEKNEYVKVYKDEEIRDVTRVTMLEAPYPDVVCTVSGSDGQEADVALGKPREGYVPDIARIRCRRNAS